MKWYVKITSSSSPLVWFNNLVGEIIPVSGFSLRYETTFAVPDFENLTARQLELIGYKPDPNFVIHSDCYIEWVGYPLCDIRDLMRTLNEEINQNS